MKFKKSITPEALKCPMRWNDFTPLERNVKALYIKSLRKRFAVDDADLAKMFRVPKATMRAHFVANEIPPCDQTPNRKQAAAWQKFSSVSPRTARAIAVCETIVSLRAHGTSFKRIADTIGYNHSYVARLFSIYNAVATDDYSVFSTQRDLTKFVHLAKHIAEALDKSPSKVERAIREAHNEVYKEPTEPATVPVEEVPDESISMMTPEALKVLKSINENLTFFRALFSGGIKANT